MLGGLVGAPEGPVASIVGDLGSLDAVSIDHDVCRRAITKVAALASGLSAFLNTGSAVNGAGGSGFCGWFDQEGRPTVSRCVQVVYHTIAGCLADTFEVLGPLLTPLVSVASMGLTMLQDCLPDVKWHHGGVTCSTEPDASTIEDGPAVTDPRVTASLVTIPHAKWGLIPTNVTCAVVVTGMTTVTADATAATIFKSMMWRAVLAQDPDLNHGSRLAIGRTIRKTGGDANDGRLIVWAEALPQDAAVHVGLDHRVLRASELSSGLPDPSSIAHRPTHWSKLHNH